MLFRTLIVLALFQAVACGQEPKLDGLQETQDAIAKIQSEVESLGEHPWAGDYKSSGGTDTGLTLWLAPKGMSENSRGAS